MATSKRYRFRAQKTKDTLKLYFYDVIGYYGITAQMVADKLDEHPNAETIQVFINSRGGSIFEGFAIYNNLRRHGATIEVFIDGLAASAAAFIAMAGDERVIAENGFVMIHNGMGEVWGNKAEMLKMADLLDKLDGQIAQIFTTRTGLTKPQVVTWMDEETWFTADEALANGFVDRIAEKEENDQASNRAEGRLFDLSMFNHVPSEVPRAEENESVFGRAWESLLPDQFFNTVSQGAPAMGKDATDKKTPPAATPDTQDTAPADAVDTVDKIELTQADLDAKLDEARAEALAEAKANGGDPPEEPKPLTDADVRQLVNQAKADSREIIALYNAAHLTPEQQKALPLTDLVDGPVDDARTLLLKVVCLDRQPVGDGGGSDPNDEDTTPSPEDRYRAEFKAGGGEHVLGCTEEEYIASRKADDNGGIVE